MEPSPIDRHRASDPAGMRDERGAPVETKVTRPESWRALVSSTTVPMELSVEASAPFRGTISSHLVGDVALARTRSVPQTVTRTSRGCSRHPADMVKVLVQRRGRAVVKQSGRSTILGPGSMTVYDTALPYILTQTVNFHADAVLIPRERLPLTAEQIAGTQQRPVELRRGAGALLYSHLSGLHDQLDQCSPAVAARCVNSLVELLSATLHDTSAYASSTEHLRELAIEWIHSHLTDEHLDPPRIAAGVGVSVRYLHQIFEGTGVSVSGYVRRERLLRIRTDLTDYRYLGETIGKVGARWGVPDQAHLSRLIRREFGCTPRDLRSQAVADSRSRGGAS